MPRRARDRHPAPARRRRALGLMGLVLTTLLVAAGCGDEQKAATPEAPADTRPSILLIVIDTLRADAVSAYGKTRGTTPAIDALAADGLLYRNAFAPSPWTLPSHASLFSGLGVEKHGVGIGGHMRLADDVDTLAERLGKAGYETYGIAENPLVAREFGLAQGFVRYETVSIPRLLAAQREGIEIDLEVVPRLDEWSQRRRKDVPFFLFVNLYDPHDPYTVREQNKFLAPTVSLAEARLASKLIGNDPPLCDRLPPPTTLDILRGLYLGDVAEADRKVGEIVARARRAVGNGTLITIVTSDHGEHLGEHGLLGHEYTLWDSALHVPLIVQGLPTGTSTGEIRRGTVDTAVDLIDVSKAITCWTGLEDCGADAPVEAAAGKEADHPLLAIYSDEPKVMPDTLGEVVQVSEDAPTLGREGCGPEDHVFGRMVSLTEYPYKLIWYEQNPPLLFDLSWDRDESLEQSEVRPEVRARLQAQVKALIDEGRILEPDERPAGELSPEAAEALRALGYVEEPPEAADR